VKEELKPESERIPTFGLTKNHMFPKSESSNKVINMKKSSSFHLIFEVKLSRFFKEPILLKVQNSKSHPQDY